MSIKNDCLNLLSPNCWQNNNILFCQQLADNKFTVDTHNKLLKSFVISNRNVATGKSFSLEKRYFNILNTS